MQGWHYQSEQRLSRYLLVQGMLGFILAVLLAGCELLPTLFAIFNPNSRLGNPSDATASPAQPNNYLIVRPQYVMSYNRDRGIPNWVSWQLNQTWIGSLPRTEFEPDSSLPEDWYRVRPSDYTGSGFDRGHLVPAADRDSRPDDRQAVFLMTNILPQAPDNNRGPWGELERYCRQLVEQGKELYIVAGGAGTGGTGEKGNRQSLRGKVAVPAKLWKVVVVIDRPELGLEGITEATRVMAVIMPNRQGIKDQDWRQFSTSVDAVEALTGYDLLSNLPVSQQAVIEAKVDGR